MSDDNCVCLRLADTHLPLALHSTSHSPSSLGGTPPWGTPGMPGGGATILDHGIWKASPSLPVTPSLPLLTAIARTRLVVVERILVSVAAAVFRVLRARRCKK